MDYNTQDTAMDGLFDHAVELEPTYAALNQLLHALVARRQQDNLLDSHCWEIRIHGYLHIGEQDRQPADLERNMERLGHANDHGLVHDRDGDVVMLDWSDGRYVLQEMYAGRGL